MSGMHHVHDFVHIVPVALRATDDMKRWPGVMAWLTASIVEDGWRIGLLIRRGEESQTGSMSDLLLFGVADPVPVMQTIRNVMLMDGVDDIVAIFRLKGSTFQALFSPDQLRKMVAPHFDEPCVAPPDSDETGLLPFVRHANH